MNDSADPRDPLDELAEEFLDRRKRGERPEVSEFVARDPARAAEIRELLSALVLVEALKPQLDETIVAGGTGLIGLEPNLERLGDFRILRELGRGGMGIVYEAEQESLGRHVALKVLSPEIARSQRQIHRFVREARAAARLHHTNIVPIFGVGEHDGLHYYAMQFIRGLGLDTVLDEVRRIKGHDKIGSSGAGRSTINDVSDATVTIVGDSSASEEQLSGAQLEREPNPALSNPSWVTAAMESDSQYARSVAKVGLQVAEALEYAHKQGTLHRDIKPSNILLDVHGVAWVTDFGLAKATEDEDLTRTGDVVGTIRYMAPERFRGVCDARSDVYGLGLALYEMLAMRPAFGAPDRAGLLHQVNHVEPTVLRSVNSAVPQDLETVIHKAIEKDASHRYSSADDLAEDLRRFLEYLPIRARRVGSTERLTRWARRNPGLATLGTAVAGMLALVVVIIAAADLRLRQQHANTVHLLHRAEHAEADALVKLTDSYVAHARASRRSQFAGRRFAGLRAIEEASRLDTNGARRLELRTEAIACLALPDVRAVGHWITRPENGDVGVDFDPSSGRIARGTATGEVDIVRAEGNREPTQLPGNGVRAAHLRFSPDGRYLAVKHEARDHSILILWELSKRAKILEIRDGMYAEAVDFDPNQQLMAVGRRDGYILLYDLATGTEVRRLAPGTVAHSLRFDPSGKRIAVVSAKSSEGLQLRDVADGKVAAGWGLSEPVYAVDWHADGRWFAVGGADGTIRLFDSQDSERAPRILEGHDGSVQSLAFHPGGQLLASTSQDGTLRLWDVRTAKELVECPVPEANSIRFSRDGRRLGPGHDGSTAWIWEVAEGAECRYLVDEEASGARIASVDFLRQDNLLVSASAAGLRLEGPRRGGARAFLAMPGTESVAVAPDGSFLVTSGATGLLRWSLDRPAVQELEIGCPQPVLGLVGIPTGRIRLGENGHTLATVVDGENGRVVVSDLQGKSRAIHLVGHANLEHVDISPDGRWVATGTSRGTGVKVWDARLGTLARELPVEGSADVVFSPDSQQLVTGSGSDYQIWDVHSWQSLIQITRSQAGEQPGIAAYSPDGSVLAIAKSRSLVQIVEVGCGREIATLESADPQNIASLGFSPDGKLLIVAFNAGQIQVWDLEAIRGGLEKLGLEWQDSFFRDATHPPGRAPVSILIEEAPWLEPLTRGEKLAQTGDWEPAASVYDEAIDSGARHVDAWARRALFRRVAGDQSGYRATCRQMLEKFGAAGIVPHAANTIAWTCALGPGAVDDYAAVVRFAELGIAGRPETNRLNTLGAVLFRAGRFEEAIKAIERSIEAHGAGGAVYDALFLAMAHHKLGHTDEARRWLKRAGAPSPILLKKADAAGDTSWIPRLEHELLRQEAATMVDPASR
jgi:WD40 repeat protein/serine/threonine protein kinase